MFGLKAKVKATKRPTARPLEHVTTCVVMNRRWVRSNLLEMGMYVSELDRPWSETRFMFQGFRIDSPELLTQLEEICEYVMVDFEKVARISTNSPSRLASASGKGRQAA